jgi:hypothetical protein
MDSVGFALNCHQDRTANGTRQNFQLINEKPSHEVKELIANAREEYDAETNESTGDQPKANDSKALHLNARTLDGDTKDLTTPL